MCCYAGCCRIDNEAGRHISTVYSLFKNFFEYFFIVKMMFYSFYLLVILVSFSGNENHISFFCQHASRANRFFAVGNAERLLHILRIQSGKHIVDDVLRLFEARIV